MPRRLPPFLFRLYRSLPRRTRRWVVHLFAPSYTVGAICVVERDDGAMLLMRHSYRSRWGLPGGLLARGEGPEDAAHRECAEEAGLEIEITEAPAVVVDPRQRRVDVVYRARVGPSDDTSAVTPRSPEVDEVRWFQPSALPDLQTETACALTALAHATNTRRDEPERSESVAREETPRT